MSGAARGVEVTCTPFATIAGGTTVTAAVAALVSGPSLLLSLSVKLTFTRIRLPTSAATGV